MNHANWNSKTAGRRQNVDMGSVIHPEETPAITKKLLALDEAQLDRLTGKRGDIFKDPGSASRQVPMREREGSGEVIRS